MLRFININSLNKTRNTDFIIITNIAFKSRTNIIILNCRTLLTQHSNF